jgi:hypothetical protein
MLQALLTIASHDISAVIEMVLRILELRKWCRRNTAHKTAAAHNKGLHLHVQKVWFYEASTMPVHVHAVQLQ